MDRRHRAGAIALVLVLVVIGTMVAILRGPGASREGRSPHPPERLAVAGTLRLPRPTAAFGVVEAGGSVWLATYGNVLQVDPSRMIVVATVPVQRFDEGSIAAGTDIWVTVGSRHEVIEIDPTTASIVRTITVPRFPVQVVADGQDVWVVSATNHDGLVCHVDGTTGSITSRSRLSQSPNLGLAAADGDLWVSEVEGLVRIDRDGAQTVVSDLRVPALTSSLAYGAGSIWSGDERGISRIDPSDGRVIADLPMPATDLAFSDRRLWALTRHPSTVFSIDPRSDRIDGQPVSVRSRPGWLAAGLDGAWVASFDPARLQRIVLADA